jgi:hypothetical protein
MWELLFDFLSRFNERYQGQVVEGEVKEGAGGERTAPPGQVVEHSFVIAQDGSSILEGGEQTQECEGKPGNRVFGFTRPGFSHGL